MLVNVSRRQMAVSTVTCITRIALGGVSDTGRTAVLWGAPAVPVESRATRKSIPDIRRYRNFAHFFRGF